MDANHYEFSAHENILLTALAGKMKSVAFIMLVIGILGLIGGVLGGNLFIGLVYAFVFGPSGIWTIMAGREFRKIVDTEGNDISHLMKALVDLKRLYTLQFWLFIVAAILLVFIAGYFAAFSGEAVVQDSGLLSS